MAGPGTHLSVHVQNGGRPLLTKIRLTSLEITFGFVGLFLYLNEEDEHVGQRCVAKVTIADRGSSSGGGAEVDLTTPVTLCEEFSAKITCIICI